MPVARGVTKQFLFKEGTNWGGLGKEQKRHFYDGPFIACQGCRSTFIEHRRYFPSIHSCVLVSTPVKKLATVLLLCCFSVCLSVYFFFLGLRSMEASPVSLEPVFLFLILPVFLNRWLSSCSLYFCNIQSIPLWIVNSVTEVSLHTMRLSRRHTRPSRRAVAKLLCGVKGAQLRVWPHFFMAFMYIDITILL